MKKIGIEAHTIEKEEKLGAGGNYLSSLLSEWADLDPKKYRFILYFKDRIPNDPLLEKPVFEKKIAKNPFGTKSTALFYNFSMPGLAKKDNVDILFLPFYMRPFFCGVKTVAAIHDISFKAHPEWFKWNYLLPFRMLVPPAAKKSKAVIVPSQYSKDEVAKYYKVDPIKVHVTYLAAAPIYNVQRDESKIEAVREKYGLGKAYFFYAATIFNRRHVKESLLAFEKFITDHPGYQFLVSGRDFTRPVQRIDDLCEDINKKHPGSVVRVGYVNSEEMVPLYQGAELFVWPSEYEGFGLPVIEAMACGTPVLTTKMTSLAEVAGDSAYFVNDPTNIDEIASAMERVSGDEYLRRLLSDKGIRQAAKFSWRVCAEKTLKIIENAV